MHYRIVSHRIEVQDPDTKVFNYYCEEICISKVITDLVSGVQTIEITIYAFPDTVSFELPKSKLNRNVLPILIGYGLTVIDDATQAGFILQVLMDSQKNAIYEYRHSILGFCTVSNHEVFLLHHPIGVVSASKSASTYIEPERTAIQGTLASWKSFVNDEVIGNINLELALAIGALAPVVHLLREDNYISLIPIIALIGKSSTGKTCSLRLCSSIWGSAGFLMDLNCTQTAFFEQISAKGLPALIDETSSVPEWDFTKVIYNLPSGKSKLRCNSDGTLKKIQRFSGAVVFTGEQSISSQCSDKRYQGIYARLLEITLPWTNDEYHAERLEFGCETNCGTAAQPLIEWLIKSRDKLPVAYAQQYARLKSNAGSVSGIADRILKICALILVAAKAMRCSLQLPLHIDKIRSLLLDICKKNEKARADPATLYDKFKGFVLDNNRAFPSKDSSDSVLKVFGERGTHKHKPCFWIRYDLFDEFLANNGVSDITEMLRTFNANGWIGKRSDRGFRMTKKLSGVDTKVYCLYLDAVPSVTPNKSKKPKANLTSIKRGSQIDNLLED